MPPDERRRQGGLGGFRAHLRGNGRQWTREEAAAAGRISAARRALLRTKAHADAENGGSER